MTELPPYLQPFVLDVPERAREQVGPMDVYLPDTTEPRPAIVFVHGGPIPADLEPTPRNWSTYVAYGSYAAGLGAVGVTLDHRLYSTADYARAADDVAEVVAAVRADPRVDPNRVALWFFSGGGMLMADWLAEPPTWLRCVAATYPAMAPLPSHGPVDPRFRPSATGKGAGSLPVVLTRVGLEREEIAVTVAEFVAAAEESGAALEIIDVPDGVHGFETAAATDSGREAIVGAMRLVLSHLRNQDGTSHSIRS